MQSSCTQSPPLIRSSHGGQEATPSPSPREGFWETGSHMPGKHKWTLSFHGQGHQLRRKAFLLPGWITNSGCFLENSSVSTAKAAHLQGTVGRRGWAVPAPGLQLRLDAPWWVCRAQHSTEQALHPARAGSADAPAFRYKTYCCCHPHP